MFTCDNLKFQVHHLIETANSISERDRTIFIDQGNVVISTKLYDFSFTDADCENRDET